MPLTCERNDGGVIVPVREIAGNIRFNTDFSDDTTCIAKLFTRRNGAAVYSTREISAGGSEKLAVQIGDLKVGAIVAVNARGDIYDWKDGKKVAGLLNADRKTFADTEEAVYKSYEVIKNKFTGATENTTIGAVITNAAFPKSSLCKIAGMAHDGYARAIRPVHTSSDGDSIYALSVGDVKADQDMVGTLGAQVMAEAILRAVRSAESAYGLVGAKDL